MKPRFFSIPKITSKWEFPNPDGTSEPVVFALDETGVITGKLNKYTATVSARKTNEGRQWTSRVNIRDEETVAHLDFYHQKPEGEGMTNEITDFCAGILWSLCRADKLREAPTESEEK